MHGLRDRQAIVRYLDGAFQVLQAGDFVICAVTRQRIPLDELRYWSVERQEAYLDGPTASKALRSGG